MTVGLWVTAQDVRDYANFEKTTGRYSDAQIGSNIRAAERFLQKSTNRQIEAETGVTKLFTTNGAAQIAIPDLRAVTTVTLNSSTLTANTTYWLLPSRQDQSVYIALQLRPFYQHGRSDWYRAVPDWFERGLDLPEMRWGFDTGIPNDLSITGDWGWASIPEDALHTTKVLAAWYTFRADAILANAKTSPDGAIFDMSAMPPEVGSFINEWSVGQQLAVIG